MKKNIILFSTLLIIGSSCELLNEVSKVVQTPVATNASNPLSNEEVIAGLKEALSIGIKNSVNLTSATDGFLKNTEIMLPFPPDAIKVKEKAMALGLSGQVEKFETTLNRAAEEATKEAIPIFVDAMESAGPYGMGWPGPRVVTGPLRIIKCDIVGKDHVRAIVAGDDGQSFKAMAFRQGETVLGQTMLHADRGRRYWFAGRAKIDDWGATPKAELHIDDIAFAD